MAFLVQCPFCKVQAKVPDRADGAVGRCPKCASSFTLAPLDDQRFPEAPAATDAPDSQAMDANAVGVAIALAVATTKEPTPVATHQDGPPETPVAPPFQPATAAGALALLLSGLALVFASIPFLRGVVIPLSGLGLVIGIAAVVLARISARRRLLLPILGTVASVAMLGVALLFPALLGPAFAFRPQRRDPPSAELRAIPLAGVPALSQVPEWVDAQRYALQRDGVRVQIIGVSLYRPVADKTKPTPNPPERLLVRVRVSLERGAKAIQRKEQPSPTLADDAGKQYALRQSEFFDRGDGKSKTALFPFPTIEEAFAFDAPQGDIKTVQLELPAARWSGTGLFRFAIHVPGALKK